MKNVISADARSAKAGSGSVLVRVLRDVHELEPFAEPWNDLVLGGAGRFPAMSHAWVSAHLECCRPEGCPWLCLVAIAAGRLVGVLPLSIEQTSAWGRSVSIVRQPRDRHTHSIDLVAAPGYQEAVAVEFRKALDEVAPGWFGLEFTLLERESPLVSSDWPRSSAVTSLDGCASVVRTVGAWDEYERGLSSNFHRQLKRSHGKMAGVGEIVSEFLAGEAARPEYLDRFMPIEAAGWKGRAGSAILKDAGLRRFYRLLAERLHSCGKLEWHFLRVGRTDVAGHLAIRSGRRLFLWKIGYDEAFAHYSPGVLLIEHMLARAFADTLTDEVNFVTDKNWHHTWHPDKRPYYDVGLYPDRPWPLLAGAWPKHCRELLKRVPGLQQAVRALREGRRGANPARKAES